MTNGRDTTRIVRSWLDDGSNAMPEYVLDAVLAALPSTPQRRPWWPLRRYDPMKLFVSIAGAAVAVVLAVVLGSALLPGNGSGVGGPPVDQPITGDVTFFLGGADVELTVDAIANGTSLEGTARAAQGDGGPDPTTADVRLECLDQRADDTWLLGGTIESSTEWRVGSRTAVIVRDGEPQAFDFWIQGDDPDSASCAAFLATIPDDVPLSPAKEGALELPD